MPEYLLELWAGVAEPVEDVVEDAFQVASGFPIRRRLDLLVVVHEPGDVCGVGLLHAADLQVTPRAFAAESRELTQRDAVRVAASDPEGRCPQ